MATYAENLIIERDNIQARLAELSATHKPSYSEDGRSVEWNGYLAAMSARIKEINKELASLPYEIVSQAIT